MTWSVALLVRAGRPGRFEADVVELKLRFDPALQQGSTNCRSRSEIRWGPGRWRGQDPGDRGRQTSLVDSSSAIAGSAAVGWPVSTAPHSRVHPSEKAMVRAARLDADQRVSSASCSSRARRRACRWCWVAWASNTTAMPAGRSIQQGVDAHVSYSPDVGHWTMGSQSSKTKGRDRSHWWHWPQVASVGRRWGGETFAGW